MNTVTVPLPTFSGPTNATLYYDHDYSSGRHYLDFLHLIRQMPSLFTKAQYASLEETYWANLNQFRLQFAADCEKDIGFIDLLVDPPSIRGYHRPFLSAFRALYPTANWISFEKTKQVSADIKEMDELRSAVGKLSARPSDEHNHPPRTIQRILIVDDVFAAGVTAAVVVEKLWAAYVPTTAQIHIAAPLRIPKHIMAEIDKILPGDLPDWSTSLI